MRRHLKEIHKKERAEIDQIIAPQEAELQTFVNQVSASNNYPPGNFEVDPHTQNSSGQFLNSLESPDILPQTNEFVLLLSVPQEGLSGSSERTTLGSIEANSWNVLPLSSSSHHLQDGQFERFEEMILDTAPHGVPEWGVIPSSPDPFLPLEQEPEIVLDSLIPEVGTNGTKILAEPKGETHQGRGVNFRCDEKGLFFQEDDAVFRSPSQLSLNFPAKDELLEYRVIQFDVTVSDINHSPLAFTWVGSSTYEALVFVKAKGFDACTE